MPQLSLIAQTPSQPRQANWLKELNLSSEQLEKIREIRKQYQGQLTEQRQAARQAQQQLNQLNQLMATNAPTEQIRQKFDQVQTLKQKLGDTRTESMLAIRNVLNAEQRQKLNAIIKRQK